MATPQPIPPDADHISQTKTLALADAALVRAATMVGLPLGVSLDGQSVQEGSAFEAINAVEKFLKTIQLQRVLEVEAAPFSVSQVVRG